MWNGSFRTRRAERRSAMGRKGDFAATQVAHGTAGETGSDRWVEMGRTSETPLSSIARRVFWGLCQCVIEPAREDAEGVAVQDDAGRLNRSDDATQPYLFPAIISVLRGHGYVPYSAIVSIAIGEGTHMWSSSIAPDANTCAPPKEKL